MKTNLMLLIILGMTISGCMSIAWIGYKEPIANDFVDLNVNNNCMKIGKQNLNVRQGKAILEASADVCRIFHSEEFKQRVLSKTWLASCELIDGKVDEISGQEVYKMIMQKIPEYSVHPHKPYAAIAQTHRGAAKVAIMPSRIEAWYSPELLVKLELVNTIAHETMHIISDRFLDSGHGANCPNDKLVSYGIGNIVEVLWICQNK